MTSAVWFEYSGVGITGEYNTCVSLHSLWGLIYCLLTCNSSIPTYGYVIHTVSSTCKPYRLGGYAIIPSCGYAVHTVLQIWNSYRLANTQSIPSYRYAVHTVSQICNSYRLIDNYAVHTVLRICNSYRHTDMERTSTRAHTCTQPNMESTKSK